MSISEDLALIINLFTKHIDVKHRSDNVHSSSFIKIGPPIKKEIWYIQTYIHYNYYSQIFINKEYTKLSSSASKLQHTGKPLMQVSSLLWPELADRMYFVFSVCLLLTMTLKVCTLAYI